MDKAFTGIVAEDSARVAIVFRVPRASTGAAALNLVFSPVA